MCSVLIRVQPNICFNNVLLMWYKQIQNFAATNISYLYNLGVIFSANKISHSQNVTLTSVKIDYLIGLKGALHGYQTKLKSIV